MSMKWLLLEDEDGDTSDRMQERHMDWLEDKKNESNWTD